MEAVIGSSSLADHLTPAGSCMLTGICLSFWKATDMYQMFMWGEVQSCQAYNNHAYEAEVGGLHVQDKSDSVSKNLNE